MDDSYGPLVPLIAGWRETEKGCSSTEVETKEGWLERSHKESEDNKNVKVQKN